MKGLPVGSGHALEQVRIDWRAGVEISESCPMNLVENAVAARLKRPGADSAKRPSGFCC